MIKYLETTLLGPIERGPINETPTQSQRKRDHFDGFKGVFFRNNRSDIRQTVKVDTNLSNDDKEPIRDTQALVQIAAEGQRRTLAAIVKLLEQPQHLSPQERQSLTMSLTPKTTTSISSASSTETRSRDSIFAKPIEQLEARMSIARKQHVRASSLSVTSPVHAQYDSISEALQMPSPTDYISKIQSSARMEQHRGAAEEKSEIQFRDPFQQQRPKPQRASTLAPIPLTELEVDPLFLHKRKSFSKSPTIETISPVETWTQKRPRPIGFPFLPQQIDKMRSPFDPPPQPVVITTSPIELPADPVPPCLSSPLSDGPVPRVSDLFPKPLRTQPEATPVLQDLTAPPEPQLQSSATSLAHEESLRDFSPFSEPSYEASDSYFTDNPTATKEALAPEGTSDTCSSSKLITATNNIVRKPRPSPPLELPRLPSSTHSVQSLKKPTLPASTPQSPRRPVSPGLSPSLRSVRSPGDKSPPFSSSPPKSPSQGPVTIGDVTASLSRSSTDSTTRQAPVRTPPVPPRSFTDNAAVRPPLPLRFHSARSVPRRVPPLSPRAPRSSTDSATGRSPQPSPDLPRLSTESTHMQPHMPASRPSDNASHPAVESNSIHPRPQLATAPASTTNGASRPPTPRQFALSMASPVEQHVEETVVQPSPWNEYLGFCPGAAAAQLDQPGAMIHSRTVTADVLSHSVVTFLKCSHSKCGFQGHGPRDKVWETSGVRFRRDFLVKSHCRQKKAKNAIYAYQCVFCTLMRVSSPMFQGQDAFMAHVGTHRGGKISEGVLARTKCITGRFAASEETWDVNLVPVEHPRSPVFESALGIVPDGGYALHSHPVGVR